MKLRLFVGLLLAVSGFLTIYLAVAISFAASYRDYVLPLVLIGIMRARIETPKMKIRIHISNS